MYIHVCSDNLGEEHLPEKALLNMSESLSMGNACGSAAMFRTALGFGPEHYQEYLACMTGSTIDHSEILRSYLHNVRVNLAYSDHPQAIHAAYMADSLMQRYEDLTAQENEDHCDLFIPSRHNHKDI